MKNIDVATAIILKDGNVLATQRGAGTYAGGWEFPGGKMEPGETDEQALRREMREELYAAVVVDRPLGAIVYEDEDHSLTKHAFICHLDSDMELLEHSDAKWLSRENLRTVDWLPADLKVVEALEASGEL